MPKVTPEIYLYEYPLSDIPVDMEQPVTMIEIHQDVSRAIHAVLNAHEDDNLYLPTTWATPLLLSRIPGLLQAFSWAWDDVQRTKRLKPAITLGDATSVDPIASIVLEWVRTWRAFIALDGSPDALLYADGLVSQVQALWDKGMLIDQNTCSMSDLIYRADGQLSEYAYSLIPPLLLRNLAGCTTSIVEHHTATWEIVFGRDEMYVISDLKQTPNGGAFAYKIEAELQTVATMNGASPVMHISVHQQRFPDGRIDLDPENDHSLIIRVGDGSWCKASSTDYAPMTRRVVEVGLRALPQWDNLPTFSELREAPSNYLDQVRIVYLTGMAFTRGDEVIEHPLSVGMSFFEKASVLDPVVEHLELCNATQLYPDSKLNTILDNLGRDAATQAVWSLKKAKRSSLTDELHLPNRILAATHGRGLEIVLLCPQNHRKLIELTLPEVFTDIFDLDQSPDLAGSVPVKLVDGISCHTIQLSPDEAELLGPLPFEAVRREDRRGRLKYDAASWRVAYWRRFDALSAIVSERLPSDPNGPVRLVLVDKPSSLPGKAGKWQDVKGAIRAALASFGYLSQFMNPYGEKLKKDAVYRVRQSILDGLRQLGVVMGDPSALYNRLGFPQVNLLSIAIIRTQSNDIRYPVFSRLTPQGLVEMRHIERNGQVSEWQPSYAAIPALIQRIWGAFDELRGPGTFRTKGSPLSISEGRILECLKEVLAEKVPAVLIVPAKIINQKSIWPQLQNPNLGSRLDELWFADQSTIFRDHSNLDHILGVVRYRGPENEVPDYYPTMDRTGKPLEYQMPHGWYVQENRTLRYLGVGITLSTKTNRETIHQDAHSLLHDARIRPGTGKDVPVGAAHRYGHPRLVEFAPFFVHPDLGEDGPLALCRVAQLSRWMGWHEITLKTPWPTHVAVTALHDALDVIAKYSD